MVEAFAPENHPASLQTLQARFELQEHLHAGIGWPEVERVIQDRPEILRTLHRMEMTGGEPDVVRLPSSGNRLCFIDCSPESPKGRRSLCYDQAALDARKENKPIGSALQLAADIGVEVLTEAQYRQLQELGEFDLKTSSWLLTPPSIRALGGAIFGDRRYATVFMYHNGAESYYASRGFRGVLWV